MKRIILTKKTIFVYRDELSAALSPHGGSLTPAYDNFVFYDPPGRNPQLAYEKFTLKEDLNYEKTETIQKYIIQGS